MREKPLPDDFIAEQSREAYRCWQKREEMKDDAALKAHNRIVIENGDPEMERTISALEQGWREGR